MHAHVLPWDCFCPCGLGRRDWPTSFWAQIGALEYDPELLTQQKHREFLRDVVVFKEVVPLRSAALKAKIHQTYRMGYVKDVILPRALDDATFATLSSLMMFNNVEVTPCHAPRPLPQQPCRALRIEESTRRLTMGGLDYGWCRSCGRLASLMG